MATLQGHRFSHDKWQVDMARTRRKASKRESNAATEKRVKELEKFLGVDRDQFSGDRSYFDWWFDPPNLVNIKVVDVGKLRERCKIASSKRFWAFVKKLDWPRVRSNKSRREKTKQWIHENISSDEGAALENRYAILHNWLSNVLSAYVVATGHSPQCSDDGTSDLLAECMGRGEKFFQQCIADPKTIVKLGRSGRYYENFHYLFHVFLHDNPDGPTKSQLITWKEFRKPSKAKALLTRSGVDVDRSLVRHFQVLYAKIP